MPILSLYFVYPDVKSIFDRSLAWIDTFFLVLMFWKELFYLKRSNFALIFIGLIHFTKNWLLVIQVAREVKELKWYDCFDLFDSFKALTAIILRNDLLYKKICTSPVLRLECLFCRYILYTQTSSLFLIDNWLELIRFFLVLMFWKELFYLKRSNFALIFIGSIHFTIDWHLILLAAREFKALKCYSICSACVGWKPIPVQ